MRKIIWFLRAAYSFYEMFFTHGVTNPEIAVPYNQYKAVAILTRARDLLTAQNQKDWLQEDIDNAKQLCQ